MELVDKNFKITIINMLNMNIIRKSKIYKREVNKNYKPEKYNI